MEQLDARTSTVERDLRTTLGRVGLVRYNPYQDTGGQMSFALAILDATGTGLIVNSLHTREGTRVYAKAITAGRAEAALSDEEAEALGRAMTSSGGSAGSGPPASSAG